MANPIRSHLQSWLIVSKVFRPVKISQNYKYLKQNSSQGLKCLLLLISHRKIRISRANNTLVADPWDGKLSHFDQYNIDVIDALILTV